MIGVGEINEFDILSLFLLFLSAQSDQEIGGNGGPLHVGFCLMPV